MARKKTVSVDLETTHDNLLRQVADSFGIPAENLRLDHSQPTGPGEVLVNVDLAQAEDRTLTWLESTGSAMDDLSRIQAQSRTHRMGGAEREQRFREIQSRLWHELTTCAYREERMLDLDGRVRHRIVFQAREEYTVEDFYAPAATVPSAILMEYDIWREQLIQRAQHQFADYMIPTIKAKVVREYNAFVQRERERRPEWGNRLDYIPMPETEADARAVRLPAQQIIIMMLRKSIIAHIHPHVQTLSLLPPRESARNGDRLREMARHYGRDLWGGDLPKPEMPTPYAWAANTQLPRVIERGPFKATLIDDDLKLWEEGQKMEHCLRKNNSYPPRVARQEHLIYHIDGPYTRSGFTLGLRMAHKPEFRGYPPRKIGYSQTGFWEVEQLQGKRNQKHYTQEPDLVAFVQHILETINIQVIEETEVVRGKDKGKTKTRKYLRGIS